MQYRVRRMMLPPICSAFAMLLPGSQPVTLQNALRSYGGREIPGACALRPRKQRAPGCCAQRKIPATRAIDAALFAARATRRLSHEESPTAFFLVSHPLPTGGGQYVPRLQHPEDAARGELPAAAPLNLR